MKNTLPSTGIAAGALLIASSSAVGASDPAQIVAALDTGYQAAVERNDWQTMERILHPDFTLLLGNGKVYSRAELIESARDRHIVYEKQVEMPGTQTVRLFGKDTATVTALLWRVRVPAVVQRHIRAHARGLALRVWAGVAALAMTLRVFSATLIQPQANILTGA